MRVLIAPSFADIFFNNCFKNGILCIPLPAEQVEVRAAPTAFFLSGANFEKE